MADFIKKELNSKRQTELHQFNHKNKEVKQLMAATDQDGQNALKQLGLDHNIKKVQRETGRHIELANFNKEYEGDVFTLAELKDVAVQYNLKLLSTKYYKGDIDKELANKVVKFKETHQLGENNDLSHLFYIMAPRKNFKKHCDDNDPLLFFRIDDNHFKLIHMWGRDFTQFRLINEFKNRSAGHFSAHYMLFAFLSLFVINGMFGNGVGESIGFAILWSLVASIPLLIFLFNGEIKGNERFADEAFDKANSVTGDDYNTDYRATRKSATQEDIHKPKT